MLVYYYFALNHFLKSLKLAFFPYINIPTLYILADNQAKNNAAKASMIKLVAICHPGGSKASLTGMTIGEKSGIWLLHMARELLGALIAEIDI